MNTAAVGLLGELARLGIEIRSLGDRLRFRPRAAIGDAMLAQLAERKQEIMRLLSQPYNCIRCERPVELVACDRQGMRAYRCVCGNRSVVADRHYEKLRAFDRVPAEYKQSIGGSK